MQRRGGSEQPVKGQSANRPKARNAPTAQVSTADLQEQLDLRTRERDEALEQLGATSDVLQVISRSAFDLKSVLQTLVESAARLCKADKAAITRQIGGEFFFTESYGLSPEFIEHVKTVPVKPERGTVSGLVLLEGRTVHVPDVRVPRDPAWAKAQELGGFRSILGVPMLRDGTPIGVLALVRAEAQPFTDKQIELVQNFANQAVVAIENTRLLNELRQRTDDLTESLEQQTATSEVLKVISSSAGELEPVFQTMLANATQICEAAFGSMLLVEGNALRRVAMHNAPPMFAEFHKKTPVIDPRKIPDLKCLIETKRVVHVADAAAADPDNPIAKYAGARTLVVVPMLKDGDLIGAIAIYRQEVRPFTNKQIELVTNFAAQAVIAIENTRLLNELRQRTADLSESLEQQTATSEVLKVISGSPSELKPVFDAILENATRICEAKFGTMWLREGDAIRVVALHNAPPAYEKRRRNRLIHLVDLHSKSAFARFLKTRQVTHIADIRVDQGYLDGAPTTIDVADAAGARTVLMVPMLKDNELVGSITIYRQEVRPFTDKQIELVKNFAAQAVIAIENTRLLNELRESLEQQTATSEVLQVISSSPGELEPVFNAILANATRICEAKFANLFLYADNSFRIAAQQNAPPAYAERWRQRPVLAVGDNPRNPLDRLATTKCVVNITDLMAEPGYIERNPRFVALVESAGARSHLAVPMLKDGELVGAISIYRQEVQPFTEKQIELLTNFAAQAVIAIENTRLLSELRESLQQQTATADVLKVISSSPGDLEPVFRAMLEKAMQLCEAKFGIMFRFADGVFRATSWLGNPPAHTIEQPHVVSENPHNLLTRIVSTKRPVHSSDLTKERAYIEGNPRYRALVEEVGARSLLVVPMLKNEELIGAIAIYWQEARSFTEKQMELISNFAAQAVIAIDNARLLSELRESLQQQTATADVLKVISRSTFDLQTVLDTLVELAARLCEADSATIHRPEGDAYPYVASHGLPREYDEYMRERPIVPGRGTVLGRAVTEGRPVQVYDVTADPEYTLTEGQRLGGFRTVLGVPLMREGTSTGIIMLTRNTVRPFSDKQIELASTFADQAAIAIENVRLFNETQEALEQQTATSEVLQVISSSPGELEPVFRAILENATRICGAKFGVLWRRFDDGTARIFSSLGVPSAFAEFLQRGPHRPGPLSPLNRVAKTRQRLHIADFRADQAYLDHDPLAVAGVELGGQRTLVLVPMLKEDRLVGMIAIYRQEVRPFTDKQIELVENFAAQAVIAIENTRLLNELRQRTDDLSELLEHLRTTQDRLVQTQKLASLGQLTAGIAHEIKNPLNFVNNFSGVSTELIDELQDVLSSISIDHKARTEINELTDTLRGNLDKVVQHGKRADAIVKNMLLHSREGSGEHRVVDINAIVEESLNLAYHGARAEKQGFTITLERSLDPAAGAADVFPQDITRALLNLISNGFYAATKRKAEVNGGDYEPTLTAATKNLGDCVEITIRDNGTGIPPEVKEKIFNPFFTTKPAGEGTGLGLSISHDIIVKQHGGSIEVDTQPGEFTELRIILPRAAVFQPSAP